MFFCPVKGKRQVYRNNRKDIYYEKENETRTCKKVERTDVTTVITFEYQNKTYKMTIPSGADFTGLLADEEYFYGYFYFANVVEATIEAL